MYGPRLCNEYIKGHYWIFTLLLRRRIIVIGTKMDAIISYCNYMRLVGRRNKLSSSNRGLHHFFGVVAIVWLLQCRESLQNIGFATISIVAIDGFYHA
jgi:hypothetical protein